MSATVTVERFLTAMATHDWDAMAGCVTDDVHRVGPYQDVYDGKAAYVEFISKLLPTLSGYVMVVDRITATPDSTLAFAELSETIDGDRTPEVLVFELDDATGRISSIAVYIQS